MTANSGREGPGRCFSRGSGESTRDGSAGMRGRGQAAPTIDLVTSHTGRADTASRDPPVRVAAERQSPCFASPEPLRATPHGAQVLSGRLAGPGRQRDQLGTKADANRLKGDIRAELRPAGPAQSGLQSA